MTNDIELCDKYAPQHLEHIIGRNEIIIPILKQIQATGTIPNLMLAGVQGTGKSTMAKCIRNMLFGQDYDNLFFELNNSKDRGINIIRETIESWCRLALPFDAEQRGIKFKVILLEEADQLTPEAMAALKNLMDFYAINTKFIFTCNRINKVATKEPAILSRFQIYKFEKIADNELATYLKWISEEEKLAISPEQITVIVAKANGDCRQATKLLQQVAAGFNIALTKQRVLTMQPHEFYNYAYSVDADYLFDCLHEELQELSANGKPIGAAIVQLANYEYQASTSTNRVLQAQAAYVAVQSALIKLQKVA